MLLKITGHIVPNNKSHISYTFSLNFVFNYLSQKVIICLPFWVWRRVESFSYGWLNFGLRHWTYIALFGPNVFTSQPVSHICKCLCVCTCGLNHLKRKGKLKWKNMLSLCRTWMHVEGVWRHSSIHSEIQHETELSKGKGKGLSHNRPLRWPKEVRVGWGPGFLDVRHYKSGRSSATRTDRPFPQGNPWYSFLEAVLTPGDMVLSVFTRKIPVTDATGIRSRDRPTSSTVS